MLNSFGGENRKVFQAKRGTRVESRHTEKTPGDAEEAGWVVGDRT